jgi:NADH-quinone oxidoreductase subunit H
VLSIVVMYGSLNLAELVEVQAHSWWNVTVGGPRSASCRVERVLPAVGVLNVSHLHLCRANRAPFDIDEAEQELVGGYHYRI